MTTYEILLRPKLTPHFTFKGKIGVNSILRSLSFPKRLLLPPPDNETKRKTVISFELLLQPSFKVQLQSNIGKLVFHFALPHYEKIFFLICQHFVAELQKIKMKVGLFEILLRI